MSSLHWQHKSFFFKENETLQVIHREKLTEALIFQDLHVFGARQNLKWKEIYWTIRFITSLILSMTSGGWAVAIWQKCVRREHSFKRDKTLQNFLVKDTLPSNLLLGPFRCSHSRCYYSRRLIDSASILGSNDTISITDHFTRTTANIIYYISCLPWKTNDCWKLEVEYFIFKLGTRAPNGSNEKFSFC